MKKKFFVEIEYDDETSFNFNVEIEGRESSIIGSLMMITRGTLQASSASSATAYDEESFPVCSYKQ